MNAIKQPRAQVVHMHCLERIALLYLLFARLYCLKIQMTICSCCYERLSSNQNYFWLVALSRIGQYGFKLIMKIVGPLAITSANVLIFSVVAIYLVQLLPSIANNIYESVAHFTFGIFVLVHILFNYYSCICTPAGTPPQCPDPGAIFGEQVSLIDGNRVYRARNIINICPAASYRYCHHCKCIKPPRCHHCSITGKCILEMDHYCPWLNNCVGYNNYRYFVLFLFYMFIGASYITLITMNSVLYRNNRKAGSWQRVQIQGEPLAVYCFTLALSAAISVGMLLVWHSFLVLTNQTTIEFYINITERYEASQAGEPPFKNPYSKSLARNWRRLMGDVPWYRCLWISRRLPPAPDFPHVINAQWVDTMVTKSMQLRNGTFSPV